MKASLLYPSQSYLGEGPLWHKERNSCFWVDIHRGDLYEYKFESRSVKKWHFDYKVTMVVESNKGGLILSLNASIARFDPDNEQLTFLFDIENSGDTRCNDAACDSRDRLWIGTMELAHLPNRGSLYCITGDNQVTRKVPDTTISNGLAWSLDNTRMYFIDSPTQAVQSFVYNEETAEITFEKNCIQIPVNMGTPDGMTIDEEGMLWIAHWGGFGVYRWNPSTGEHLDTIELPVPNVTSCVFAGENLDQLIITTAAENLSDEELRKYPQSGDVFIAVPGVRGVENFKCSL